MPRKKQADLSFTAEGDNYAGCRFVRVDATHVRLEPPDDDGPINYERRHGTWRVGTTGIGVMRGTTLHGLLDRALALTEKD